MSKVEMTRYLERTDLSFTDKVAAVLASEALTSREVAEILYYLARDEAERLAGR